MRSNSKRGRLARGIFVYDEKSTSTGCGLLGILGGNRSRSRLMIVTAGESLFLDRVLIIAGTASVIIVACTQDCVVVVKVLAFVFEGVLP